jgi:hypothetical protein
MADSVLGFNKEYRFLSNFYPATVELDGLEYVSTEHAYQAAKTADPAERRRIRESQKPGDAKRLGKQVKMRTDWEQIKIGVMKDLVLQKFTKHKELKEKLLATGDMYLEETNTWRDFVWGVCNGKGQNHLGKILMEVREEIRKKEANK